MTRTEYEQRLKALEQEIADLKLEVFAVGSEIPPHQKPKLEQGDRYYYVASDGTIIPKSRANSLTDSSLRAFGNVFLTYDAAEYAAEYFRVLGEMREWAGKWDDPWAMVYTPPMIASSIPPMITPTKIIANDCSEGELRFATQEDAENCIKAVGKDRLIKYYFGVRDHEIPAETE